MKSKAIFFNLLFIILELIGFFIVLNDGNFIEFKYYTEDSNLLALIVSIIYLVHLIFKIKITRFLSLVRLTSVISLMITFLTVIFILMPSYNFDFNYMYWNSNLFFHLICPLLYFYIYFKIDRKFKAKFYEILYTLIPTFIYAIVLVTLNIINKIDGPYPFLRVHNQEIFTSISYFLFSIIAGYTIGTCINKIKNS